MNNYMLPPPPPLEIHDLQAAEKWKRFKRAWENYSMATGLSEKKEEVQVAALLTVIGEEAWEVFSTFSGWERKGDNKKIEPVLAKFQQYCEPQKNVPFERYLFNRRCQEPGESYDQYRTALRKLAESCSFDSVTPDEILRDRLVFGIRDNKTRERLLRESTLTLKRTDELCHAAETMMSQLKYMEDSLGNAVSAVLKVPGTPSSKTSDSRTRKLRECCNCGRRHEFYKRELCPAFGKLCHKCKKPNHYAGKCRSQNNGGDVKLVDESSSEAENFEEIFPLEFPVNPTGVRKPRSIPGGYQSTV